MSSPGTEHLIHDLFSTYEPLARPVEKESEPLEVNYGISLQRIDSFDTSRNLATFDIWENYVSSLHTLPFKNLNTPANVRAKVPLNFVLKSFTSSITS